ncbi:MAG TPA: response regulator [Candidatus Wallbacteria bacterium]|nr:response regulator [Candidatus Wallbacteria bacterium]
MGKKILVVDDEVHIVNILKFNLKKSGYDVITAANGEEALGMIASEMPDLILCDVMMPKLTGFEVCQKVKNDDKLKAIPFILLTAKGQEVDKDIGLKFGADLYLTKPFSPKNIVDKVTEILALKQ